MVNKTHLMNIAKGVNHIFFKPPNQFPLTYVAIGTRALNLNSLI